MARFWQPGQEHERRARPHPPQPPPPRGPLERDAPKDRRLARRELVGGGERGARREGEAPVLVALAVDREAELVPPARVERERAEVDRERHVDRGPRLQPGRAADLEPA